MSKTMFSVIMDYFGLQRQMKNKNSIPLNTFLY